MEWWKPRVITFWIFTEIVGLFCRYARVYNATNNVRWTASAQQNLSSAAKHNRRLLSLNWEEKVFRAKRQVHQQNARRESGEIGVKNSVFLCLLASISTSLLTHKLRSTRAENAFIGWWSIVGPHFRAAGFFWSLCNLKKLRQNARESRKNCTTATLERPITWSELNIQIDY